MQANVIIDIEGVSLSAADREMIRHPATAGVILFTRNYHDRNQLQALTASIQKLKPGLVVAVDQEGGRLVRFSRGFSELPAMAYWGERYQQDPRSALADMRQTIQSMAQELLSTGVNMTMVPVLDLDKGVSDIIGERSFGGCHERVARLAHEMIITLRAAGMPSIAKHFPGHGSVRADSHTDLPVDSRGFAAIQSADLVPFSRLATEYDALMPAHILFDQVDPQVVTYSRHWLQTVLRGQLGFDGVIMSDDLTMAAATHIGGYAVRAEAALAAGCDMLIVCNNPAGASDVLEAAHRWGEGRSNFRTARFLQHFNTHKVG